MCSSIVSSTMDHQDGKRTKIIQQEDDSPIEGTHTICDLSALNQSYVSKLNPGGAKLILTVHVLYTELFCNLCRKLTL